MSEDRDLLDKIGTLAGRINRHRTQTPSAQDNRASAFPPPPGPWQAPRGGPYSRGRARTTKSVVNPHRHRTLVMNNQPEKPVSATVKAISEAGQPLQNLNQSDRSERSDSAQGAGSWVTKRDRHMQLINSSIYDKETQIRNKAIEETRKMKAARKDQREQQKIQRHLKLLASKSTQSASTPTMHEIVINGLRFHVLNGGSKLARIRGPTESTSATPKKADVGGVTFLRSKSGNLHRSGVVKVKKRTNALKKKAELCKRFTSTGHCPKGPSCLFIHDPAKVAICKDYLQTGDCPAGESCDLSHEAIPERVPACLHYLRGKCSNPTCRYAHVRVNPAALVCNDFAVLGYCSQGANCLERHVHECPDYANTGVCRKRQCHLPHVDRAGQIRKHTANVTDATNGSGEDDDSDLVSDDEHDEIDTDDFDSDSDFEGFGEHAAPISDEGLSTVSHALSQQQDFVRF